MANNRPSSGDAQAQSGENTLMPKLWICAITSAVRRTRTSGALWQVAAGQAGKHPAAARYATDFIVKALRAG